MATRSSSASSPALNRQGGNITGVTQLNVEVGPKRLELMHELVPTATTIAVLLNPSYPSAETELKDMQAAARTLGLQVPLLRASNEREIDEPSQLWSSCESARS